MRHLIRLSFIGFMVTLLVIVFLLKGVGGQSFFEGAFFLIVIFNVYLIGASSLEVFKNKTGFLGPIVCVSIFSFEILLLAGLLY